MEKKKKASGVNSIEQGFMAEPLLTPIQEVAAASYTVSPKELAEDMKEAGLEAPEKPEKPEKKEIPVEETGVGQVEEGFLAESPLDILAAASAGAVVSPKELKKDLAEVGIEMPDQPKKEHKEHEGPSGVESIEEGFLAEPEMSIVEELGAIKYAAAPKEIADDVEKVEEEYGKHEARLTLNEDLLAKLQAAGYTGDLEALKKLASELK